MNNNTMQPTQTDPPITLGPRASRRAALWQIDEQIRVKTSSAIYKGQTGYIEYIGTGPAEGTILVRTNQEYSCGTILFAIGIDKIEKM